MSKNLIARATPGKQKIFVAGKKIKYTRVCVRHLTEEQCVIQLLKQVAKVTLKKVKEACRKQH